MTSKNNVKNNAFMKNIFFQEVILVLLFQYESLIMKNYAKNFGHKLPDVIM